MNEQAPSKDRVSDFYLESTLNSINLASALDSQLISTAFLRMLLIEIIERRAAHEPPADDEWCNDCREAHILLSKKGAPDGELLDRIEMAIERRDKPPADAPQPHWSEALQDDIYYALDIDPYINRLRAAQPPGVLPDQADVLAWAIRSFGPIAQNEDERAARVAEEAIEIAQVEGVPIETIKRIADRVYSRPAGERWQEIGGTMIGMLSYAEIIGLSLAECTHREFQRVLSKPREWWQKKHAEKVAAGTADLSPCSTATKEVGHE